MFNPYHRRDYHGMNMNGMFIDYDQFLADLVQAINDEAKAAEFYTYLMEIAPNAFAREQIEHARDDERKHLRQLSRLYRSLTGQRPMVQKPEIERVSYRQGLKMAFNDELEAAEHYRSMLLSTGNFNIRDLLFEIMTDEMEHATRFAFIRN